MKKTYKKSLLGLLAASLLAFSFSSCFNPVFYQINQDVPPESANVSGSITTIARYTVGSEEYLVTYGSNGSGASGLLYKPQDGKNKNGQWSTYDCLPFELHHYDYYGTQDHVGQQIIKVVSDATNLYLVTVEYTTNDGEGTSRPKWIHLWTVAIPGTDAEGNWIKTEASDWTDLNTPDESFTLSTSKLPVYEGSDDYYYSAFNVFSTNAPIQANRKAYLRSGIGKGSEKFFPAATYFELSGSGLNSISISSMIIGEKSYSTSDEDFATYNVNAAAIVNGSTLFFGTSSSNNTLAVTTNETYTSPATKYYYSHSSNLFYGSNSSDMKKALDAGSYITSLAYTKDSIIIGRGGAAGFNSTSSTSSGGVQRVELVDDIPNNNLGIFATNAQSQLLTSYIINTIINASPDQTEENSNIYASISFTGTASSTTASFSNIGLWAYYKDRGNWNRE